MAEPCLSLDLLERLVREGTLVGPGGLPDGAAAEEHLRDCSHCRARLAEMREVDAFIAGVSRRVPRGSHDARDAQGALGSRHDPHAPSLRDNFPGYAVEAIVDVGGQGAIYKARQLATGRVVAIKVPLGDAVRQPAKRYRFRREIELTSRLDHPGIVGVFGVCEASDGRIGCVMEFVEGRRFDEWAEERRGPGREGGRDCLRQVVAAAARVAEAIAYAHQRGVLHRDLKPSNVLVTAAGLPRVLDFGLAKALDSGSGSFVASSFVTATGAFLGTLAYAAPEQVDGRSDETDVRTDVYGIGLVLYQALAGRVPWESDASPPALCAQIQRGDAPRPTPLGGAPDAELDAIVLKAVATDMDRRYPSAALLAEDLDRWLTGRPVRARFDSRWYVVRKTAWRKRWWIAAAAFVLGLVGTLLTLGLKAQSAARQAALAKAIHNARELESHWSSIADARAIARDDFLFGEQKVWEVFLNAGEAVEQGGIEGADALGHRFSAPSDGLSGDASAGSDWSTQVPTSPAYWALAEIYLRTPVRASLPELLPHPAAIDSINDRILVGRGRTIERWDWRTGQVVGRIDLPLPEGASVSVIVISEGWAAVRASADLVALVDLGEDSVFLLPRTIFTAFSSPYLLCVDVTAGYRGRHAALWCVDGGSPRLLWSRDLEFQVGHSAIDDGGNFLAVLSPAGELLALDVTSGVELFHRGREDVPHYRKMSSRGRPGEILTWDSQLAALQWTEAGVMLNASPDGSIPHGGLVAFLPGSRSGRYFAHLDRIEIAVGDVDQPVGLWRTIPGLKGTGSGLSLSADDRHALVSLEEGERHAIVDLDSTGVTQIAQPTEFKIGEAPTTFSVGFVDGGGALLTASMDGSLRRYSVSPDVETVSADEHARGSLRSPSVATSATPASENIVAHLVSRGLTCFAVDGASTYVGTHELGKGDAKLFRVRDGVSEFLLDDGRSWYCGIVLEPGSALWALGGDGRLFRMNLRTDVIEAERPIGPKEHSYRAIARMAHRGLLIVGSRYSGLHLLDETTLEPTCEGVPMPALCDIVVSPTDPDLFVTTHDTGVIRVWRVTGGSTPNDPPQVNLVREMGAHAGPVFCTAFHPSGRILATGGGASETRDVRLWDLESGRELAAFSLFDLGVFSVAFSPDGRWLAAGGEPVPGRYAEGGQLFLIDLTAAERSIAGNLEYHISRLKRANGGELSPRAEMLRRRFASAP